MSKIMYKLIFVLFVFGLAFAQASLPPGQGKSPSGYTYNFDPAAELDTSKSQAFGYTILMTPPYPWIVFRDPAKPTENLAMYNWKEQYWGSINPGFTPSKVNLASLFKRIDLSKTSLDRDIPGLSPQRQNLTASPSPSAKPIPSPSSKPSASPSPRSTQAPSTPSPASVSINPPGAALNGFSPDGLAFAYDEGAVLKAGIDKQMLSGYTVFVMAGTNRVLFDLAERPEQEMGIYDWKKQYWYSYSASFKRDSVNLAGLYSSINLSKTILNREIPGMSHGIFGEAAAVVATRPTFVTAGFPGFVWDKGAELDTSWNRKTLGGYAVMIFPDNPYVIFRSASDHGGPNLAQYSWAYQFWWQKDEGFEISDNDLASLFLKLDRNMVPVLNRPYPQDDLVIRKIPAEDASYDYSADLAFARFVDWMDKRSVKAETKNFYLHAASNPVKLGKSIPHSYGALVSQYDTGMIPQTLKPVALKGVEDGDQMRKAALLDSGGIRYYLELHEGKYLAASDFAYNVFTGNASVPVTIVEIDNSEYKGKSQSMLRGTALRAQAEKDLERFFHKDFSVRWQKLSLPYSELAPRDGWMLQAHLELRVMDKYVHPNVPKDQIIIYYFTDAVALYKVDDDKTHPLMRGPYGSEWAKMYESIIHELGHSLGMMHHFGDRVNYPNIEAHISPACVMNYKYVSQEFCELCRYSLKIEK